MNLRKGLTRRESTKYSLKGHFHCRKGAHAVVCTIFHFLSNQSVPRCIASSYETTLISILNIDPIMDPSLKSIKVISCSRINWRDLSSKNEQKFSEVKIYKNQWMINLHLICSSFAKKILFVFEFYCVFTLWVLLNRCIHSNFCLWKLELA